MFQKFTKMLLNKSRSSSSSSKARAKHEAMHNASNSYFCSLGNPVWSGKNYFDVANHGYSHNVIAHRAINMLARAAASIPLKVQKIEDGIKYPIKDHSILNLINRPNPTQGGREFFESLYSSYLISGNAYILGAHSMSGINSNDNTCIKEMYMLRPDRVEILTGNSFQPLGYRYSVNNKSINYTIDSKTNKSQIMHFKNFNPLSDWYGLSPLEVATFSIDQHNQASAWNQALLQNGARPSGAIIVKNSNGEGCRLSPEQLSELKSMFSDSCSGPENAGRPLLLEGGLEWKEMSLSPKDMDYIESKNSSAREIALALGVPPQLLGIPGDNTYSNLAEARIAMWEQTVVPMVENLSNHMTRWFAQHNPGENIEIVPDTSQVGILAYRVDNLWDRLNKNNFLTVNEKRQEVGLEPVAEGNKVHISI